MGLWRRAANWLSGKHRGAAIDCRPDNQEQKIATNYNLIIVGTTGPETENIKNLIAEFKLETKVSLLSALSDSELGWLYQNCEAFIIASSTEGFCLPLAEALHFSDRVVCSDIPIFREIATDTCTYFDLGGDAIDNLSQAITEVMKNSATFNSADINRFDKSHIAQQYLDLYHQVGWASDNSQLIKTKKLQSEQFRNWSIYITTVIAIKHGLDF